MPKKGYKQTKEHIKKVTASKKGRKHSKKTKAKMRKNHRSKRGYTPPMLGKKVSEKTKRKIGEANQGENNGIWKGNKVKYDALHAWIKRHKPKPEFCEECKKNKPYDLANISGKYKRDVNDFQWLCRSCHMKDDGRLKKLHKNKRWKACERCREVVRKRYKRNKEKK